MTGDLKSDLAGALRRALASPIYNRTLKKDVGRGQLDYEVYLRTGELLALQTAPDQLVVGDELLFQIVHQTQELWLKLLAFEAAYVVDALEYDEPVVASATLSRMVAITHSLRRDIEVLFTLSPDSFQVIRRSLGNGSGLESPGYNAVLLSGEAIAEAFTRWCRRRGSTDLCNVYARRDEHPDLHRIAEQMCDLDGAFQGWLMSHFLLVRRTIGIDRSVRALDGFPTQALPARMTKPLFPELWDVRVEMTQQWVRDGGFAPGAERARRTDSGEHPVARAEAVSGEPE